MCEKEKCGKFGRIRKDKIVNTKFNKIMSLLWSKNGFRGEYLSKYIVSKFAFISESNVSEDYGIDFYCGLIKDALNTDYVHYDKPFLLQIKTKTKEGVDKNDIVYDTRQSLHTLYNLKIPFFIGYLDLVNQSLEIFSTSTMWHPFIIHSSENLSKITFKFPKTNKKNLVWLPEPKDIEIGKYEFGCGKNYIVNLGHPIIKIGLQELEKNTDNIIEESRKILSKCIDRENDNIQNQTLRLHFFRWVHDYETNNCESFKFGYKFYSKDDGAIYFDANFAIEKLNHFLISLAITYKETGDDINFENVCKLTRQIPEKLWLENIKNAFPKIYKQ